MNTLVADSISKCVFVYIDDILGNNEQDHVKHLQLVFHKLKDAGQQNPTKYAFVLPNIFFYTMFLVLTELKPTQIKLI